MLLCKEETLIIKYSGIPRLYLLHVFVVLLAQRWKKKIIFNKLSYKHPPFPSDMLHIYIRYKQVTSYSSILKGKMPWLI